MGEPIEVTVAWLAPGIECVLHATVRSGDSIADAIAASGVVAHLPGGTLGTLRVGVWGKLKPATAPVCAGDRVEIYRPLTADPKAARQRRVAKRRAAEAR